MPLDDERYGGGISPVAQWGTITPGEFAVFVQEGVICGVQGNPGSGTVTSITAGNGLTGGTITTSGTIGLDTPVSLANGGTGQHVAGAAGDAVLGIVSGTGLVRRTGVATYGLDTSTYLTANQTITLGGDVTGAGSTVIPTTVVSLQHVPVSANVPAANQILQFVGGAWTPQPAPTGGAAVSITAGAGITVSPSPLTGTGTVAMTNMAANTVKGNNTAFPAAPIDLTVAQTMTLLGAAPLASPVFTGVPVAPTATAGTNTTQVATTAFVTAAVQGATAGVSQITATTPIQASAATGAVTLSLTTVPIALGGTAATTAGGALTSLGAAPLNSPVFTGTPSLPTGTTGITQTAGNNTTALATTAFVSAAIGASTAGVSQITATSPIQASAATGAVTLSLTMVPPNLLGSGTPSASTVLYGNGTWGAPTGGISGTLTTNQLTYGSAASVVSSFAGGAVGTVLHGAGTTTLPTWSAVSLTADVGTSILPIANGGTNASTAGAALTNLGGLSTATAAATYAPIASPTFTGTPAAPTATAGTSTTQLATTAFVMGQGFATGGPYAPLAGATFTGKVTTVASAAANAGFNLPAGAAPTAPANGDLWTTNAGLYARINNVTVGPYGIGSVTSVSSTGPGGIFTTGGSPITGTGTLTLTVAGTSGGIPYFSTATNLATSGTLTASALVLGGGAGAAPVPMASLGTTTTVLHGNAAGAPTWGAVTLTTDVAGILPVANGGTGQATAQIVASPQYQLPYYDQATASAHLAGSTHLTTDANGLLAVNRNATGMPAVPTGVVTSLRLVGADNENHSLVFDSFGAAGVTTSVIMRHAEGSMASGLTATLAGDTLGSYAWRGYYVTGGPAYSQAASARFGVTALETFTSTAQGAQFGWQANQQGTTNQIQEALLGPGLMIGSNLNTQPQGTGSILVQRNTATALPPVAGNAGLWINFADSTADGAPDLLLDGHGAGPTFLLRSAMGTGAAPLATAPPSSIGGVGWRGYYVTGGPAYTNAVGRIDLVPLETFTSAAQGTQFQFMTVTPTTATQAIQATLGPGLTVGNPNPGPAMQVGYLNAQRIMINGVDVGTGGGSGTVNNGAANQLAFYSAAGTAVSGNTHLTETGTETFINYNTSPLQVATAMNGETLEVIGPPASPVNMVEVAIGGNPNFDFLRANNTAAALGAVASGQVIGRLTAGGFGATQWRTNQAALTFQSLEAWSDTVNGCSATIYVTPATTASPVVSAVFGPGLSVGANPTAPSGAPMTNGDLNVQGRIMINGSQLNPGFAESAGWLAGANPNNAIIFTNNSGRALNVTQITGTVEIANSAAITVNVKAAASGTSVANGTTVTTTAFNNTLTPGTPQVLFSGSYSLATNARLGLAAGTGTWDNSVGIITVYVQ